MSYDDPHVSCLNDSLAYPLQNLCILYIEENKKYFLSPILINLHIPLILNNTCLCLSDVNNLLLHFNNLFTSTVDYTQGQIEGYFNSLGWVMIVFIIHF